MNRHIWTAMAIAVSCAGVATAQTGNEKSGHADRITVAGCLQQANGGPTGTSGSSSTKSSAGGSFILTTIAEGSSGNPPASGVGTTGTASSRAGSSGGGAMYVLQGHESELKQHRGHRVEVTGTPASKMGVSAGMPAGGAPRPADAKSGQDKKDSDTVRGYLTVQSVRAIDGDCRTSGK
jgi:hypothetical protein